MGARGPVTAVAILIVLAAAPVALAAEPWEYPVRHEDIRTGPGWNSYRFGALDQSLWIELRTEGGNERVMAIEVVDHHGRLVAGMETASGPGFHELRINDGSGDREVLRWESPVRRASTTFAFSDCLGWLMMSVGARTSAIGLEVDCPRSTEIGVLAWGVGDDVQRRETRLHAADPLSFSSASGEGGIFRRAGDFGGAAAGARADAILLTPSAVVAAGGDLEFAMQHGFHGSFGLHGGSNLQDETMDLRYASPTRAGSCPCAFHGDATDPGTWTFHLSGADVADGDIRLAGVDARYPAA